MRRWVLGASAVWLVGAVAFGSADLRRVADLVRTGDRASALALLSELPAETLDRPSVTYLRGRLLLDVGRPCDALEVLDEDPAELPEPIRVDSMRRWARAAARCGRCAEARSILRNAASSEVSVTRRDRAVAADCAVQLGELEAAATELEALTRRSGGLGNRVALLARLSDVYLELGRPDDAKSAALRAWRSAVRPSDLEFARRLQPRAEPSLSDRIDRAEAMMSARRFEAAAAELESIDPGDDELLVARWHHAYGMALFRTRTRYLEAARVLHASSRLGGRHAVEDAFHSARALSRADKDGRAVAAYRRFAKRYPKSRRAPEARFLAAWLEIRLGRPAGEKNMERLVRGPGQVRGRWRRAALWELGFRAFETRRASRAVHYLRQYTELSTTAMDRARGAYWLGRSYRAGPKAVEAYRAAIAVEPLHWYAVLAAARLQRLRVEPPAPFDRAAPRVVDPVTDPLPVPPTFALYESLGLDDDGIAWLRAHENELVAERPAGQRAPLLAGLYAQVGAHREALRVARKKMAYLSSDPSEHRWWWDAAYPMPWRSIVDAHRGELPRSLVYATMRQESGFQPAVVSRAGAIGLMQVMPELANKLAGAPVSEHALRTPEINIELGLREMNALAEELGHVYPLSIAAYNAGKSRVRRWLRESGKMELDRFVERIPFNETRNYVRRVSTHFARYAYLDDPDSGWPSLPRFVRP